MHIGKNGENEVISFNIPKDTEYLWLIVTGAPTKHNKHLKEKRMKYMSNGHIRSDYQGQLPTRQY